MNLVAVQGKEIWRKKLKKEDFQDLFAETPMKNFRYRNQKYLSDKFKFSCYDCSKSMWTEELRIKIKLKKFPKLFGRSKKNPIFKIVPQKKIEEFLVRKWKWAGYSNGFLVQIFSNSSKVEH